MSEQEKQEAFGSGAQEASGHKAWGAAETGQANAADSPGAADPAGTATETGKAKAKGKAKGKRGGGAGGMMDPAAIEQLLKLSPEEQRKTLEGRGLPPEMIDQALERIKSGGGPGGPPGGGPGGGFGGPQQGGGPGQ
jgi:hypothetical protein